jgi:ADP-ribose pyrophosphatase
MQVTKLDGLRRRVDDGSVIAGDQASQAYLSMPERLGTGFRHYDRFSVSLPGRTGGLTRFDREVLRSGPVVGVLAVDFDRQQVVLTRQFRLGGHLAADRGEMIEIVAGRIDPGEQPEQAARRECFEEIGVHPFALVPLFDFAPAPALTDEFMTLFLARIDADQASDRGGLADEDEEIAVVRIAIDEAIKLPGSGTLRSGPTIIALQWLAQNFPFAVPEAEPAGQLRPFA